jgi:tetratricopeptide (TPR) repeat protein
MGENDRALRCVDAALNLDSRDADALRFKAEVLDALGRKDEAQQTRTRAAPITAERKDAPSPTASVAAKKDARATRGAEDIATRVLALVDQRLRNNPHDTDALFALAAVLARANDLLGADAILEKLAQTNERYPDLWLLKAQSTQNALQNVDEWSLGSVTTATSRVAHCIMDNESPATNSVGTGVNHAEVR